MAEGGSRAKLAKRYGPIVLVVALVGGVIAFAGDGGDDDDVVPTDTTPDGTGDGDGPANPDLPMTFQEAQAAGTEEDIDWGPGCDTELGRMMIPITSAAPCVEPWDESQENGGATSEQGVTAEEIVVAVYQGRPDPLAQAIVEGAGADTDPNDIRQVAVNYLTMFEDVYETYGRRLRIEVIEATGGPEDAVAALADAQKVIDLEPFAAIGGPPQTSVYWQELVNAGIVCVGICSLAEPWDVVEEAAPYLWPTGPSPDQADMHLVEMLEKQIIGQPVSFAGDAALNGEERVYGFIQAERIAGEFTERNEAFLDSLRDKGANIATTFTYLFDVSRAGETATNAIARMKEAGVTTVIMSVDPIIPSNITKEATAQNYAPEWILGPNVLMDTTIFGRQTDQEQWSHMIGLSLPAARAERELGDSYLSHLWYFGEEPPVNSQGVFFPGPERLLLGIHLAGPNLDPENFRDGLFRYPASEQGVTYATDSWGDDLWGRPDYNAADDVATIWWDPDAEGEDEAGNMSVPGEVGKTGMVRYVDGGRRYMPGDWPTDPIPWFEEEGSVTIYDERPDAAPDYPPWPGSPGAAAAG
ncbi:MAG: hypothetical protein ACT4OX_03790 [Actinomycetota bacterium]